MVIKCKVENSLYCVKLHGLFFHFLETIIFPHWAERQKPGYPLLISTPCGGLLGFSYTFALCNRRTLLTLTIKANRQWWTLAEKQVTLRTATARSIVSLPAEMIEKFANGDIQSKKGGVFQTAIIAGIMAAKKTGELIPLCHPLGLDNCKVNIHINEQQEVVIDCTRASPPKRV
jgi:hypothetical protein